MEETEVSNTRNKSQMDRYRTLVEELNDIATDGRITYVSQAVTRVLGYDPDEL
ncbi:MULTISPECIES: PAS domain-containing protein [Salinibaculum]|uniref:PAS domain-containing protein n=1 Tax=Salinibaculum TaxID=2732368 RepID=UPI003617B1ED